MMFCFVATQVLKAIPKEINSTVLCSYVKFFQHNDYGSSNEILFLCVTSHKCTVEKTVELIGLHDAETFVLIGVDG